MVHALAPPILQADTPLWPSISFAILVTALLVSAFVLWRRYRSRQQLMQRVAELEALSAAGRAIVASELDMTQLCQLVAAEAGKIIDNSTFQVGLFDGPLYHILFWQIDGRPQPTPQTFNLDGNSGLIGWIRSSKQPLLVYDFQKEMSQLPAQPRYVSKTPPRSAIFIPLISGEDGIGMVAAQHSQPNHFNEEDIRRLMILSNQAAAAIAHAQLFAVEQQRAAQLTLVGQIARQLDSVEDLEDIFDQVVQVTRNTFNFHPVSIFLREQQSGDLVLEASSDSNTVATSPRVALHQGLVGTAATTQRVIVSNNTAEDERFLERIADIDPEQQSHTRSEMALPLLVQDEVLGVLDVQSDRLGAFNDTVRATLETLAAEVAIAVDKTRQLLRQREAAWIATAQLQVAETLGRNQDLDALTTAVARLTPMLTGVSLCAVLLWDETCDRYQLMGFHAAHSDDTHKNIRLGIGSWSALDAVHVGQEQMETTHVPDWLRATHSESSPRLMLLPIHTPTQYLGVFVVSKPTIPDSSDGEWMQERRIELLQNIATQTATAVENANLRRAQQEEAWVNTALLQVAEAVNSLIDLNEILGTIVRLVPMLVGVQSALILIWDEKRKLFYPGPGYGIHEMGRGLLQTLEIDEAEIETLSPHLAHAFTLSDSQVATALPHWLELSLNAPYAHVFPLNARGALVGLLLVGVTEQEGRSFSPRRLNILNGIAQQAATAVVNNHLYKASAERSRLEQELDVARKIQSSLIPAGNPNIPACTVASFWQAARQVSGDFYDFMALPDGKWGIVIADVADKGVPAALFMALSRTILRTVAFNRVYPGEVLMRTNRILDSDAQSDLFVTAFYAVWDAARQKLTYANAGHNPPLLLHENGRSRLLTGDGIALGVLPEVEIAQHTVHLKPNDTLIFYTDGVTEAMNEDFDEFGMQRLKLAARRARRQSAEAIMWAIRDAINSHAGDTPQFDDITLVVMKRQEE